jgi:hypothetical protein
MRKSIWTATLLVGLLAGEASANLLVNGSFEQPAIGSPFVVFNTATQGIPGWTITNGDVDINQNNLLGTDLVAETGEQWIDLNGFGRGIIAQFFATVPGQTYALQFFYADNPFSNGSGSQTGVEKTGAFTVRDPLDGNVIITQGGFSHSTTTGADADWTDSGILLFTAASTLTRLAFSGDVDSGSTGPFLDSVSVTAVPEPTTLALFGLMLAGLALARRPGAA